MFFNELGILHTFSNAQREGKHIQGETQISSCMQEGFLLKANMPLAKTFCGLPSLPATTGKLGNDQASHFHAVWC